MSVLSEPIVAASRVLGTAMRWSRWVAVAGLLVAGVVPLLPAGPAQSVVVVLSGAGLLAGLPHGAIDHHVAAALTGRPTAVVAAAYAAAAGLTWTLLTVGGPVAVVAVLALSLAHFGAGELEIVRESTGWRPSRAPAIALAVAGTGALVLPLARSGDLLARVATGVSPQLGVLIGAAPVRITLACVWVVAAVVAIGAAARAHQGAVVLDVVLIGALGVLAPPLLAFALWFGGWHGLRHCARLLTVDERCAPLVAEGHPRRAVLTLARLAAWPTLAATATLAGLVVLTVTAPDATSATSATLVVLLALTVPHMLVVGWLDLRAAGVSDGRGRPTR